MADAQNSSVPPKTQRAWQVVRSGSPAKALQFRTDLPIPTTLKKGEVLVKVQAAALNPVGYKLMKLPNFLANRPCTAENDFAGVVVDEKETDFKKGDPVFGWIPSDVSSKTRQGALSEYTVADASLLVQRPENVTPVEAAGLSLAGQTAYLALVRTAKVESGQRIFINGGSSSVGGYAVQIAKALGATVVASSSANNIDHVKSLGADEALDYTASPLHGQLKDKYSGNKFDAIFDSVGLMNPNLYTYSDAYLSSKGSFVSVGPMKTAPNESVIVQGIRTICGSFLRPTWLGGAKAKFKIVLVGEDRDNLVALQKLVAEGKVKPIVDSTFKFEDALKAYERILTGRAKGKVVVQVSED